MSALCNWPTSSFVDRVLMSCCRPRVRWVLLDARLESPEHMQALQPRFTALSEDAWVHPSLATDVMWPVTSRQLVPGHTGRRSKPSRAGPQCSVAQCIGLSVLRRCKMPLDTELWHVNRDASQTSSQTKLKTVCNWKRSEISNLRREWCCHLANTTVSVNAQSSNGKD